MASSLTEIANLAISHLGTGKEIASLTENSEEASVCNRFIDHARRSTLRDSNWPFATVFLAAGLVESEPTNEWNYSYRYPADCLRLRRVLSGIRNDTHQSRVPFRMTRDATGLLIYSDQENACFEYTINETDVSRFSPDFDMALSYRLAMYIAPRLTKGDPFAMKKELGKLYLMEIDTARSNAFNEQQPDILPESEFIRGRE